MKPKIGDIFEIPLEEGVVCYSQALSEPEFAFYITSPLNNEKLKPIFRLWVHKSAIREWNKIGNQPLTAELESEVPRFKQDPINGSISIYKGEIEQPATHEQIQGLECAAVWEGNHINDRLTDHLAGRKNIWVESMRPKLNG
ncbi:MAG: hypothetical protein GY694_07635 [Gammaproteobacteria bacterium]|nr:hypothetical protein [Gammaproteobacteria bacterium]